MRPQQTKRGAAAPRFFCDGRAHTVNEEPQPQVLVGRDGQPFRSTRLQFGNGLAGRLATRLGAQHWPLWRHVWAGDMAVVGPRPRQPGEAPSPVPKKRPAQVNDCAR